MGVRSMRVLHASWLAPILFVAGASIAYQSVAASDVRKVTLHIEPQPVGDALSEFGRQTGLTVMIQSVVGKGVLTGRLEGLYTPTEALSQMLAPTGLHYEYLDNKTVAVLATRADSSDAQVSAGQTAPADLSQTYAQQVTESPSEQSPGGDSPAKNGQLSHGFEDQTSESQKVDAHGIPEILVRGSRTLNMDVTRSRDDVQPYVIFDRATIEQSGAADVSDFLKQQLPMNAAVEGNSQQASTDGNRSSISLRGLGERETLVLVDGHRLVSSSGAGELSQSDINGIPLAAIERIEVLPSTASGIYGGSATGGVINVVLRRDYSGIETKLTYGGTFDGGAPVRRVDASAGFTLEGGKTNILLFGSYVNSGQLLVRDRNFIQTGRAAILNNNPAFFFGSPTPPLGSTTNITSITGENLTLKTGAPLNSPFTYVPPGYAGAAADAGAALVGNAGKYNLGLANTAQMPGGGDGALWNGPTVKSLRATLRREFNPSLQVFLEVSGSEDTGRFNTNAASSSYSIPSTAPNNPFNQDIQVTTPAFGADSQISTTRKDERAVAGFIVRLSENWRASADYTWDRSTLSYSSPLGLTGDEAPVVASGSIDVLRDTNVFLADFSPFVAAPIVQSPLRTTLQDSTVRVAGPLWTLPAGPLNLTGLLEHRKDSVGYSTTAIPSFNYLQINPTRFQTVDSAYLEMKVPVVSGSNATYGLRELELQVAGRVDHYKTNGTNNPNSFSSPDVVQATDTFTSVDPTVGLRYKPVADVMLRASYATGFVPPGVDQLVSSPPTFVSGGASGLTDPRRGNETVGQISQIGGGNANLKPEKSKGWSIGTVLTPRLIPGARLSIDWSKLKKTGNIEPLADVFNGLQGVIDNEGLVPSRVTRAAPSPGDPFGVGPITAIDVSYINLSRANIEACDFAFDYSTSTGRFGSVSIYAVATRQIHYQTQIAASAPLIENAGLIYSLKWKGNLGLTWKYRQWTSGWLTTYFDHYFANSAHTFDLNQGSASVASQIYHDVFLKWTSPTEQRLSMLSNLEVQVGSKNVFDHRPPFDANTSFGGGNLYSVLGDPRLATYYISVKKGF
jgi:iron complex outermembrane receptor protein